MGSCWFTAVADGINPGAAFVTAVEGARDRYGNEGYTGSIAEKSKYRVFLHPPLDWRTALGELESYSSQYSIHFLEEDQKWIKEVSEAVDDKWGPAGCFRLTDEEARKVRPSLSDDSSVYVFFGWASS